MNSFTALLSDEEIEAALSGQTMFRCQQHKQTQLFRVQVLLSAGGACVHTTADHFTTPEAAFAAAREWTLANGLTPPEE